MILGSLPASWTVASISTGVRGVAAHSLPSPLISQTDIALSPPSQDGSIVLLLAPTEYLGVPGAEQYLTDRVGESSGWFHTSGEWCHVTTRCWNSEVLEASQAAPCPSKHTLVGTFMSGGAVPAPTKGGTDF